MKPYSFLTLRYEYLTSMDMVVQVMMLNLKHAHQVSSNLIIKSKIIGITDAIFCMFL